MSKRGLKGFSVLSQRLGIGMDKAPSVLQEAGRVERMSQQDGVRALKHCLVSLCLSLSLGL